MPNALVGDNFLFVYYRHSPDLSLYERDKTGASRALHISCWWRGTAPGGGQQGTIQGKQLSGDTMQTVYHCLGEGGGFRYPTLELCALSPEEGFLVNVDPFRCCRRKLWRSFKFLRKRRRWPRERKRLGQKSKQSNREKGAICTRSSGLSWTAAWTPQSFSASRKSGLERYAFVVSRCKRYNMPAHCLCAPVLCPCHTAQTCVACCDIPICDPHPTDVVTNPRTVVGNVRETLFRCLSLTSTTTAKRPSSSRCSETPWNPWLTKTDNSRRYDMCHIKYSVAKILVEAWLNRFAC